MDQGQYIEVMGRANAAHLNDVVLPRCEQRMNEAHELRALQHTGAPSRAGALLAWLGARLIAAGERLQGRPPMSAAPGA
jgi:hypothetical protein